jgi:hypothetical protein
MGSRAGEKGVVEGKIVVGVSLKGGKRRLAERDIILWRHRILVC